MTEQGLDLRFARVPAIRGAKDSGGRLGCVIVVLLAPDKWVQGVAPEGRTTDVAVRTLQARLAVFEDDGPDLLLIEGLANK